ncbi:MAG: sulfatase-like hydrolase/transferase [Pseudomonadota bacterium]|nr:sulfatase-like hydrolase/transferase [Pseudomonadota bacterium]
MTSRPPDARPRDAAPLPHPLAYLWYAGAGGLCGGSAAGAVEALIVLSVTRPSEYQALAYAYLAYGLLGAVSGVALGALLVPCGRLVGMVAARAWCLGFFAVAAGLGAGIVHLSLGARVGAEAGMSLVVGALALGAFVGVWLGGHLLTKTPLRILLRGRGTASLWGAGLGVAALLSLSPAPGGTGTMAPRRPQPDTFVEKPDVLVLVVDGLRADALPSMPALSAFASDAVVFEQSVAASSWTRASIASLLSSRAPSRHGAARRDGVLADEVVTLSELLRDAGYATGGLPGTPDVSATWGLDQGFDWYPFDPDYPLGASASVHTLALYATAARAYARIDPTEHVRHHYRPADEQLARAREFLDANAAAGGASGDRAFLFVHLLEPQAPWFPEPLDGTAYTREAHPAPPPEEAPALRLAYAVGVSRVDAALGRFFASLSAAGRYDDLLIVVTAGQGLELGDHGGAWDGTTAFDEIVHVPLLVKLPGNARGGTRVPWQVRQVDIAPTIADLTGFAPDPGWEGLSLFDDAFDDNLAPSLPPDGVEEGEEGAPDPEAPPFAPPTWANHPGSRDALIELDLDGTSLQAVRSRGRKLVQVLRAAPNGRRLPSLACYDLLMDPGELRDLTRDDPTCAAALAERLQLLGEGPPSAPVPEPLEEPPHE